MTDIFVVMGSCGEYSDRREWPVAWYANEQDAIAHSARAAEDAKRIERELSAMDVGWYEVEGTPRQPKNTYDPGMKWDYTGAGYYHMRVPAGWVKP